MLNLLHVIDFTNVVGYAGSSYKGATETAKWNPVGIAFAKTGVGDKITLGQVTPTGWDWQNDEIRILNPLDGNIEQALFYVTPEVAEEQGFTKPGWNNGDDENFDDEAFDLSQGFLTRLYSDVSLTASGEVYKDEYVASYKGATDSEKYVVLPNPLPRRIQLKDIKPTGWDWQNDELRIIYKDSANIEQALFYVTPEVAEEQGFTKPGWNNGDDENFDDRWVEIGEGFMLRLYSDVSIQFPAAIESAE